MKAIVVDTFGSPDVLQYREVPEPQAEPGQALIRTTLTSVNYADVQSRRGGYDAASKPPFTPGLDCVGVVESIAGSSSLKPGQRVVAFPLGGSYAEKTLAKIALVYPIPDALSNEAVSGLTVLLTAYNLLTWAGRLQAGETVLVHAAAGGVGSTAVQLALARGAKVIGVVSNESKAALLEHLGAEVIIGYEDFAEKVLNKTSGLGADLILDSVAGAVFEQGLKCLAPFGRLVIFGHSSGEAGHFGTRELHRQTKAIVGYSSGHYRRSRPEALRPSIEAIFGHLLRGEVRLEIGAKFSLSEAAKAHALMESRQSVGKILLYP